MGNGVLSGVSVLDVDPLELSLLSFFFDGSAMPSQSPCFGDWGIALVEISRCWYCCDLVVSLGLDAGSEVLCIVHILPGFHFLAT